MTEPTESPLRALLCERIATEGPLNFAEFMQQCLYHPEYGYYMTPRQRIGKQGDFFTSSSVHALFGRLLARQLAQMWEILGGGPFTVQEQGAGDGHLALDILDAAAQDAPQFYAALRYQLLEVSPVGRARQQELLAEHAERVSWVEGDQPEPLVGCILSNELVDAFPVHLVEMGPEGLQEVRVGVDGEQFVELLGPPSSPRLAAYFERLGLNLPLGYRSEVNLAAEDWIAEVAARLERGFVLTIDYGYPAQERYAPHRDRGTLMCFQRHTSSEDPYQQVGRQDMTSHVDFTTLQQLGSAAGLTPLYFGEQYRFLMGLGFVEALMELQAAARDEQQARALRLTLKNLILPGAGMGETFKVLVQGKGVGQPELLCQRRISDIPIPPAI